MRKESEITMDTILLALNRTAEVSEKNAHSTAVVIARLEQQETLIRGLSNTTLDIREDVTKLEDRITAVEMHEEITTEQKQVILDSVHRRIRDILGNDPDELAKYRRAFTAALWSDAKRYAGVGSKFEQTKKENYQRAIDYIEAWIPPLGCGKLKTKIDERAAARRRAKTLGYE